MALMPTPPTPITWTRPGAARRPDSREPVPAGRAGGSAGMGLHQLGDAVGRVGAAEATCGTLHSDETVGIVEELVEHRLQPGTVAPAVLEGHGCAGVHQRAGVGALVVAGRPRQGDEDRWGARDR